MEIYTLSSSVVAHGEDAFRDCIWQYFGDGCPDRKTGRAVIPGAIVAALRNGFSFEGDICRTVARVSRCREATVYKILYSLADDSLAGRMWENHEAGHFRLKSKAGRVPAMCFET